MLPPSCSLGLRRARHAHAREPGDVAKHLGAGSVALSDALPGFEVSAGCNSMEDCALLQRLETELAALLGGVASEPTK